VNRQPAIVAFVVLWLCRGNTRVRAHNFKIIVILMYKIVKSNAVLGDMRARVKLGFLKR
jgi:hypothetical protein